MALWLPLSLVLIAQAAPRQLEVELIPPRPVQGGLVVVEVRGAKPKDRLAGRFIDHELRFFIDEARRVRALSAVPLNTEPGAVSVTVRVQPPGEEPVIHSRPVDILSGRFGEQALDVDRRFVKPPKSMRTRIRRERAAMKKLFSAPPTKRKWRGSFAWPRRDVICSAFGLRRVFNGELRSRHWGLDIDGRTGDPVRAIGAGRAVMVADRYYSGGTVVIDHGLNLFSLYFHLSAFAVKKGQRVSQGQLIGQVGKTGRVTGPHLHISTKVENISFNPVDLFEFAFSPPATKPTGSAGEKEKSSP